MSDQYPLCDIFAAHTVASTMAALARNNAAALEPVLEQFVEAGRTPWPSLTVPAPLFVQHAAERIPAASSPSDLVPALRDLAAPDLYLACGCTHGIEEALRGFEREVMQRVPTYLSNLRLPAAYMEDVQQEVRRKLLVSPGDAQPAIARYNGRGKLANFVRAVAIRTAISGRRNKNEQAERDDGSLLERLAEPTADPVLESMKRRYLTEFKDAIGAAIAKLTSEQRNLLRLFYVDGMTTVQLGAMFGVNQSNTSRRLTAARAAIFDETKRSLRSQLQLSDSSFEELSQLVQSQLDLSLTRLLK